MGVQKVLALSSCSPCTTEPRQHTPSGRDSSSSLVVAAACNCRLHEADQKLLGSDSGKLDVAGAVRLLRAVHTEVARSLGTAVNASPPDGDTDAQQEQQHQEQQQEHARPGAARGRRQMQQQARRAARVKKAKSAALWRDLGRASYMLAALSASGLISEYLPPPQLPAPAATAALCRQLQAVVGSAPSTDSFSVYGARRRLFGSDSSQQPACKVASSDPAMQQELEWLVTAATAGTAEAQMALADRCVVLLSRLASVCPLPVIAVGTCLGRACGPWLAVWCTPQLITCRHGALAVCGGANLHRSQPCHMCTTMTAFMCSLCWCCCCRFLMGRGGLGVSCENGLAWLQQAAAAVMRTAEAVSSSVLTLSNLIHLACIVMPHCWGHRGCSRPLCGLVSLYSERLAPQQRPVCSCVG